MSLGGQIMVEAVMKRKIEQTGNCNKVTKALILNAIIWVALLATMLVLLYRVGSTEATMAPVIEPEKNPAVRQAPPSAGAYALTTINIE